MNEREFWFLIYTFFMMNLAGWFGYCLGVLHERGRTSIPKEKP
jgi:hypothetical protein